MEDDERGIQALWSRSQAVVKPIRLAGDRSTSSWAHHAARGGSSLDDTFRFIQWLR